MKITAFNPIIVTPNAADAVALFEELGFERRHTKEGIEGNVTSYDLKYGDFRVNVAQADNMPQDLTAIRMNVRDFDEAYDFLTSKQVTLTPKCDRCSDPLSAFLRKS